MEKFYLQVNAPNVITITLMWMIGMAVVGFAVSAYRKYSGGPSPDA